MSKVSNIVDRILLLVVLWVLSVAIIGYFIRVSAVILLGAFAVSLSLTAIIFSLKLRKSAVVKQIILEETFLQFYLNSPDFSMALSLAAFSRRIKCKQEGEFIVSDSLSIYPHFFPEEVSLSSFCKLIKTLPSATKKLVVLSTQGASVDVKNALEKIDFAIEIKILAGLQTYKLLRQLNALPEKKYQLKQKKKRNLKKFFASLLAPKNARRYLLTALLLLGSSLFMPLSIYFLVVGGVCIVLAVVSSLGVVKNNS